MLPIDNPLYAQLEKFGQYNMESTLVNGRPHYTSERDNGAYAIWYVSFMLLKWLLFK